MKSTHQSPWSGCGAGNPLQHLEAWELGPRPAHHICTLVRLHCLLPLQHCQQCRLNLCTWTRSKTSGSRIFWSLVSNHRGRTCASRCFLLPLTRLLFSCRSGCGSQVRTLPAPLILRLHLDLPETWVETQVSGFALPSIDSARWPRHLFL